MKLAQSKTLQALFRPQIVDPHIFFGFKKHIHWIYVHCHRIGNRIEKIFAHIKLESNEFFQSVVVSCWIYKKNEGIRSAMNTFNQKVGAERTKRWHIFESTLSQSIGHRKSIVTSASQVGNVRICELWAACTFCQNSIFEEKLPAYAYSI